MDRDEALRLLQGEQIGEWNWRLKTFGLEIPDLDGAVFNVTNLHRAILDRANLEGAILAGSILVEAQLVGANLHRAILDRANLEGTNLEGANLIEASLDWVNLARANLVGANLHRAGLIGANLARANLHRAILDRSNLAGANLARANLAGANLAKATCVGTVFAGVDLSEVKGLKWIVHKGPSHVSTGTLFRSRGKIPRGVPAGLRPGAVGDPLGELL